MESWRNESGVGARAPRVDTSMPPSADGEGSARLYILILISFYGVFLLAIMVGYLRSRRRERRRTNVFTRLLHEEEQREWGARLKKDSCASLTFPPLSPLRSVPPPAPAAPPREQGAPAPHVRALLSRTQQRDLALLVRGRTPGRGGGGGQRHRRGPRGRGEGEPRQQPRLGRGPQSLRVTQRVLASPHSAPMSPLRGHTAGHEGDSGDTHTWPETSLRMARHLEPS